MGLRKYRNDKMGKPCPNGSIACYTIWMGGHTLAEVHNCPVVRNKYNKTQTYDVSPRIAYVQHNADTFFTRPAAICVANKRIKGFIMSDESGYSFTPNTRAVFPPKKDKMNKCA